MATSLNLSDPRVKRTRQLLLQAFTALLEEKQNFHSISVQDIAERATVNRATFYAHFEDKYAMLESWMRDKFHRKLELQLPTPSALQTSTLRVLILTVFDFFARFRQNFKPADRQFEPLFEIAVQQELYDILLTWLKQVSGKVGAGQETVETTSQVISWAIFGPAAQWSRGEQTVSAEEMVQRILIVVTASLSPVITLT